MEPQAQCAAGWTRFPDFALPRTGYPLGSNDLTVVTALHNVDGEPGYLAKINLSPFSQCCGKHLTFANSGGRTIIYLGGGNQRAAAASVRCARL